MIPGVVGFPRSPIMLIEDSESNIYICRFVPVWKDGFYFQRGISQVLPDLHGGGANQTSLRYEDVIQQVKFSTTDEIFNGNTKPISSWFRFFRRFAPNLLSQAQLGNITTYVFLVVMIDLSFTNLEIQLPHCLRLKWRRSILSFFFSIQCFFNHFHG